MSLLPCQLLDQELSEGSLTSADNFCGISLPSSAVLPPDDLWESWQLHRGCNDDEIPAMGMSRRRRLLLLSIQEELALLELSVHSRSHQPCPSLATAVPKLPSPQRLQICSQEFLLDPSSQLREVSSMELGSPAAGDGVPGRECPTADGEGGSWAQAEGWVKQRESRGEEDSRETQASGRPVLVDMLMEISAETHGLENGNWRSVMRKHTRPNLTQDWDNQKQLGVEKRVTVEDLGDSNQRETGSETPDAQVVGVQTHKGEKQPFRGEADADTLMSELGVQDKSQNEGAIETQKCEAEGEDEGETQAQEMGEQDQARSKVGEEAQKPREVKQDQSTGNSDPGLPAGEWRSQKQAGEVKETSVFAKKDLGEVKRKDEVEAQAWRWAQQESKGGGRGSEIQSPVWGHQRARGERLISRAEIQKRLKHELQIWGGHSLRKEEDSRKNKLKEIREEDWIVIHALWWAEGMPAISNPGRESEKSGREHQGLTGGKIRGRIQTLEKRNQRKKGGEENTSALETEAETLEPFRDETHGKMLSPGRKIWEQLRDKRTDMKAPEERNLTDAKWANGGETQELGEGQGPLDSNIRRQIPTAKQETEGQVGDKDGTLPQMPEAEKGEESPNVADGESHSPEGRKEAQEAGEGSIKLQIPKNQGEEGEEEKRENQVLEEESQSQAGGETEREIHSAEPENWAPREGKSGTEREAPPDGGEHGVETPRTESANQGPVRGDSTEGQGEQTGGKNDPENQTLERRSQSEPGSEAGSVQDLQGRHHTRLRRETVGGLSSERLAQGEMRGENDVDTEGKRRLRGTSADGDSEAQAPGEELINETGGESWTQGQEQQNKCGEEAEDERPVGSAEGKDQSQEMDVLRTSSLIETSGGEDPPVLSSSSPEALEKEEAETSAPCSEVRLLPETKEGLASREGEPLASQNVTPDRGHQEAPTPAPRKAPPKPPRKHRQNREGVGVKASGLTLGLPEAMSPAALSGLPSQSLSYAHKTAPAPRVLKKRHSLLLEPLMRCRALHLQCGLPRRVLESHLLSGTSGLCPGLQGDCGQPGPQEGPVEAQNSKTGLDFSKRTLRADSLERKSWRLSLQGRELEKLGTPEWASVELARRVRPPEGLREPWDVQEMAHPRAQVSESRSWCGPEKVPGPAREGSRRRKTGRPGISLDGERSCSRVRASRSSSNHGSQEASHIPKQPSTFQTSLESAESRELRPQPSAHSSFNESFQCTPARQGTVSWKNITCSPHLALHQLPTPKLSLRQPSSLLHPNSNLGCSHSGEDSIRVRPLQYPAHVCAGVALPNRDIPRGQGVLKKPKGTPVNLPKFNFMKLFRNFLLRRGFRK